MQIQKSTYKSVYTQSQNDCVNVYALDLALNPKEQIKKCKPF